MSNKALFLIIIIYITYINTAALSCNSGVQTLSMSQGSNSHSNQQPCQFAATCRINCYYGCTGITNVNIGDLTSQTNSNLAVVLLHGYMNKCV